MTPATKKIKKKRDFCRAISLLLLLAPLIVFVVIGFVNGTPNERVPLGISLFVALILTLINAVFKFKIRSALWVLMWGLSVALNHISTLIMILMFSTLVDELIFVPLAKKYSISYKTNMELDKRLSVGEFEPEIKE